MTRRHRLLLAVIPRRGARDPEGETLAAELRRRGYGFLAGVRAGKVFILEVEAGSLEEAVGLASRMAGEARLYNPLVHEALVVPLDGEGCSRQVSGD